MLIRKKAIGMRANDIINNFLSGMLREQGWSWEEIKQARMTLFNGTVDLSCYEFTKDEVDYSTMTWLELAGEVQKRLQDVEKYGGRQLMLNTLYNKEVNIEEMEEKYNSANDIFNLGFEVGGCDKSMMLEIMKRIDEIK